MSCNGGQRSHVCCRLREWWAMLRGGGVAGGLGEGDCLMRRRGCRGRDPSCSGEIERPGELLCSALGRQRTEIGGSSESLCDTQLSTRAVVVRLMQFVEA